MTLGLCKICQQEKFSRHLDKKPKPAVVVLHGIPVCKSHVSRALREVRT